jgi:site-specific DNA-methyltransferase (adenine-specific)
MTWEIINASVLDADPGDGFDAVLCDAPYGLGKTPNAAEMTEILLNWIAGKDKDHTGGGFMGKTWDSFVPGPATWRAVFDKMKPGAHLMTFSGTRTQDLMGISLRLADFQVRDSLCWLYGSGFPKNLDISKAIDKAAGAEREIVGPSKYANRRPRADHGSQGVNFADDGYVRPAGDNPASAPATPDAIRWDGQGTALKPAHEPICLARKPLDGTVAHNALAHGCGGLNIEGGRIGTEEKLQAGAAKPGANFDDDAYQWGGTCNPQHPAGRWPANLLLDESAAEALDQQSGESGTGKARSAVRERNKGWCNASPGPGVNALDNYGDTGGASRFFYTAKASASERNAGLDARDSRNVNDGRKTSIDNPYQRGDTQRRNTHPTVKPIDLCRYLATLLLPPPRDTERRILVPFSGSGSEMIGAHLAGWEHVVGIELDAEYCAIAEARLRHWTRQNELFPAAGMAAQLEIK